MISARAKTVIVIFFGLLVVSPALLDIQIRHERKALQTRAKNFLLRPCHIGEGMAHGILAVDGGYD